MNVVGIGWKNRADINIADRVVVGAFGYGKD
jgi:hypothetical protein